MSTLMTNKLAYFNRLKDKIEEKTAVVGVIGLGYVGLPNVIHRASYGFNVVGFDKDESKVNNINNGISYIDDVETSELSKLVKSGMVKATADASQLNTVDVITICVPTPIDEHKQPDLRFIESAMNDVTENVRPGSLVILESTTYPGTTEEYVVNKLEEKGFEVGHDIFVAYSPERIDPSNKVYDLRNTPRVIGGHTEHCGIVAELFISGLTHVVESTKVAEMAKVFENTFRFVNIALANELAEVSEKMNIDVWEVIDAAKTKPFGFMAFYPTAGIGGHCIPVDPYYLTYKAKDYSVNTRLINTAGEINSQMNDYTVNKLMRILNDIDVTMNNSKIAILGATYKKDISDVRESPIFNLVNTLEEYNGQVDIFDPYVTTLKSASKTYNVKDVNYRQLRNYDVVIILTDHSTFDLDRIKKFSNIIFDTKNALNMKEEKAVYYKL
ncbi:nucleotide sugar dehydrogenase [Salinibacillus aidingensis]|uniref:Nucleotide sugar dehydrogenase n=1 Tax=Salinibacillus aidingensis TaxID=237684 RepID=A0ABP3KUS7_9BACI